eukprot:scaffold21272_cov41-Phaeocystis_antarctica.AAC.1
MLLARCCRQPRPEARRELSSLPLHRCFRPLHAGCRSFLHDREQRAPPLCQQALHPGRRQRPKPLRLQPVSCGCNPRAQACGERLAEQQRRSKLHGRARRGAHLNHCQPSPPCADKFAVHQQD